MTPEIDRCIREQARCAEHIRAGKPDQEGARLGLADWIGEEILIRTEPPPASTALDTAGSSADSTDQTKGEV